MRLVIISSALAVSALAMAALPAAAAPGCEKAGSRTLHNVESKAGPAGPAVHTAEGVYCATPAP